MAAKKKMSLAQYMSPDGFETQPAEGPIVQDYNFSPGQPFAFDPGFANIPQIVAAPTPSALQSALGVEQPLPEAGTPGDPMALAPKIDQTEIGIQDALDPLTGKGYAGTVRPKVQSFSEADKQTALKNAMGMGLQTTPEMVILGAGMARDKSLLSDKNFEGPNREDMQREQAGVAKAGQESSIQKHMAIEPKEVLAATKMVEETPAITEAEKNISDQETALKKLLDVEQSIDTWAKIDMTMSLAFMDELYGTKLVKSYKPYAPPEATIQKLQQHINENKGKLSAQKERMYSDLLKDKDVKGRESSIQGTRSVTELPPGTMAAKIAAANKPSGMGANGGLTPWQEYMQGRDALERADKLKAQAKENEFKTAEEKLKQEKADTEAVEKANKILDPGKSVRIFSTIDQIMAKNKEMEARFGKVPGTGRDGLIHGTSPFLGDLYNKGQNIAGYLKGGELAEYNAQKDLYNSAKLELAAAVTNAYSGQSTTDEEIKKFYNILVHNTSASPAVYREAVQAFKRRYAADMKMKYATVMSDPRLREAVKNRQPADIVELETYFNSGTPDYKADIPGSNTPKTNPANTPNPKPKVTDAEIDELLK